MNHTSGPDRASATSLSSPRTKTALARVDFTVTTRANCELAWRIFSECEEWNKFLPAYGKIEWLGERWAPGSRLRIELTYPAPVVQDRVITVCNPPRCVGWINHVVGFTLEQWVLFDACGGGGTRISTWVEITGTTLEVDGHDVPSILRSFIERWYANFAAECDRMAPSV